MIGLLAVVGTQCTRPTNGREESMPRSRSIDPVHETPRPACVDRRCWRSADYYCPGRDRWLCSFHAAYEAADGYLVEPVEAMIANVARSGVHGRVA